MMLGEQTAEQQLEQAAQLFQAGDRAGAVALLERLAQTQELAITAGRHYSLPKDLDAAERAAYALTLLIRMHLSTPGFNPARPEKLQRTYVRFTLT